MTDALSSMLRLIYDIESRYPRMCSEIAHEYGFSSLPDAVMYFYKSSEHNKLYDICMDLLSYYDLISIDRSTKKIIEMYCKLASVLYGECQC